jgi:hypothetical protein
MSERRARRRRDASLSRVGKVTKGVVAASVAGAGALTLYVARALPGHQAGAAGSPLQTTTTTTTSAAPPATTSPVASAGSAPTAGEPTTLAPTTSVAPPTTIAPPTTAPTRTTAPPVVSSGAS